MSRRGVVLHERTITFRVLTVGELDTVNPGEHRLSELKRRSLRNNPLAGSEDPAVVHAFVRGEFAAKIHLFPGELCFVGERVRCFFGSDFFTESHFRPYGVGGLVLKKALSVVQAPFVVCGVTPQALKTYQAAGMVHMGEIPHYIAPLRSEPFLRRLMRTSVLSPLADKILHMASKVIWKRIMSATELFRLEEVTSFDRRLDEITKRYSPRFWFPRTSAFLNWVLRFPWDSQRQKFNMRAYLLWSAGSGDYLPAGAMLLRFARPGAEVVPNMYSAFLLDYFARSDIEGVILGLLAHAFTEAKRLGCDVLEVGGSDPVLNEICRSSWMRRISGFDILLKPYRFGSEGVPIPSQMPSSIQAARLTLGEGDVIFS